MTLLQCGPETAVYAVISNTWTYFDRRMIGSPGRIRTSDQPVNRSFPLTFGDAMRNKLRQLIN